MIGRGSRRRENDRYVEENLKRIEKRSRNKPVELLGTGSGKVLPEPIPTIIEPTFGGRVNLKSTKSI